MNAKIAWFHCFSGIAGDMALGALVDAGADLEEIKKICAQLNLPDWDIQAAKTLRNGISGTKIEVLYDKDSPTHKKGRKAAEILKLIEVADLPESVKQKSLAAFTALAEAEGKLHQKPPEEIHFHEVGGVDAIIDIVGVMAAIHNLGIESIYSSPVAHGTGTIECEHGTMPNPPPAVVELLKSAPTHGVDIPYELTTPTGAALLKTLVVDGAEGFGPLPKMEIAASGFGAGTREFKELPNLLQVIIGQEIKEPSSGGQPVVLMETNLDDITGEMLADSISRLISAGAHDAWATPIIMKKGRPAYTLSALADPADSPAIADLIIKTTGTLGIRTQTLDKFPQPRTFEIVELDGQKIRVKVAGEKKARQAKAEYEDLKAAASATGKTLVEIEAQVMKKWKEQKND